MPADLSKKNYHIVQIGLGVVGSAYAQAFKSKNMKVTGIEYNKILVEKYKNDFEMFHSESNIDIVDVDFILLSVCTPLIIETNELDMTFLLNTVKNVLNILKNSPNAIVVIRSTVIPGMTKKYQKILEDKLNIKVRIAFVPEFLREVSAVQDSITPWYVCLGIDKEESTLTQSSLIDLYSNFIESERISVISIEEAEVLKIFHNSFNACKISFFNQCDILVKEMNKKNNTNIDMQIIANNLVYTCEGLINPKYGTLVGKYYSKSCLKKDPNELVKLEEEYNLESKLFKSIVQTNEFLKKNNAEESLIEPNRIPFDQMKRAL